jgi:U3 small nucleolar RNA-associated protein 4
MHRIGVYLSVYRTILIVYHYYIIIDTRDGTIVSGDSLGHVKFWDAEFGILIENFASHQADVLTLAVLEDDETTMLFASGVDHKIVQFKKQKETMDGGKMKWVMIGGRRFHTHDVRSLAIAPRRTKEPSLIASGGVDTMIHIVAVEEFQNGPFRKISPFPVPSIFTLVKEKGWLLCQFAHNLHLWRLGHAKKPKAPLKTLQTGTQLTVEHGPLKLLDFYLKVRYIFLKVLYTYKVL